MTVQRVFISYETDYGLEIAEKVAAALEPHVKCWYWHRDHKSGAYTWEEIVDALWDADRAVIVCTAGTHASNGQRKEIGTANNRHQSLVVLGEFFNMIPRTLLWGNADFTDDGIEIVCNRWLTEWQVPLATATTQGEGDPLL